MKSDYHERRLSVKSRVAGAHRDFRASYTHL
jgi:hypothetical protein